jgi:serine/threonine-protein kinase
MPDPLPKQIGKYEIQAQLGEGGFGRVYRAFDPTVPRVVAIKVLSAPGDRGMLVRFRNEAAAAGNLNHKNIVTIYESSEYDSQPFIAMQFVEGEDLQRVIESRRPLTLLEKVSILWEVADGLAYAHHHSVIHRDIKPANIMLQTDGGVKIMDFGIARVARENATRLTHKGDMLGTLRYMAPESFSSSGQADALGDIFAYGDVCYELISGRHPFDAPNDNMMAFIARVSMKDAPPLRAAAPECPEALEEIVRRALQRDRDARYQSLDDLMAELKPLLFDLQRDRAAQLADETRRMLEAGEIDPETAQSNLRRIVELDPTNREAQRLRPAIQQINVRPRVESIVESAKKEFSQGNFPAALKLYESALRLDRQNSEIRGLLEEARRKHEESKLAARLITEAQQQLQRHELSNAYRNVSEVLRMWPGDREATELLSTIQAEMERRENQKKFSEGMNQAGRHLLLQEFDRALEILAQLESNPERTAQLQELMENARSQKAEQERYARLRDETTAVREILRESRFEEGVWRLEALAREFPDAREVADLLTYAREGLRLQQTAWAVKEACDRARAMMADRRFDEALDLLDEAFRTYPGESELGELREKALSGRRAMEGERAREAAVRHCLMLFEAGRLAEASRLVDGWLRDHPQDPELLRWQERIRLQWDQQERAEAVRRIVAESRRKLEEGQAESAVLMLQRACAQYPGEAELSDLLREARGQADCNQGRRDAQQLLQARRFDGATKLLHDLRNQYPADQDVRQDFRNATVLRLRDLRHRGAARDVLDGATELLSFSPGDREGDELRQWAEQVLENERRQAESPPEWPPASEPVSVAAVPEEAAPLRQPTPAWKKPVWIGAAVLLIAVLAAATVWWRASQWANRRQESLTAAALALADHNYAGVRAALEPVLARDAHDPDAVRLLERMQVEMQSPPAAQTAPRVAEKPPVASVEPPKPVEQPKPANTSKQENADKDWQDRRRKALQTARQAIEANRYDVAVRVLQPVVDHDPGDAEANRMMASAKVAQAAGQCPPPLRPGAPGPKFFGDPNKALLWAGTLNRYCELEIRGSEVSAGRIDPRQSKDLKWLPGIPATVTVESPAKVTVEAQPTEKNNFTLKLRNGSDQSIGNIRLNWRDNSVN